MKAQVLYGIGDLRYEDIEKPQLKEGWVMVKVMAAAYVVRIFQEYIIQEHMFILLFLDMNFQVK